MPPLYLCVLYQEANLYFSHPYRKSGIGTLVRFSTVCCPHIFLAYPRGGSHSCAAFDIFGILLQQLPRSAKNSKQKYSIVRYKARTRCAPDERKSLVLGQTFPSWLIEFKCVRPLCEEIALFSFTLLKRL